MAHAGSAQTATATKLPAMYVYVDIPPAYRGQGDICLSGYMLNSLDQRDDIARDALATPGEAQPVSSF